MSGKNVSDLYYLADFTKEKSKSEGNSVQFKVPHFKS